MSEGDASAQAASLMQGLHPAQLFHVGVVAEDIDKAMAEMSANLGLTWKGGKPTEMDLVIDGEERRLEMRIAHSRQGPPYIELIQAVPGTPWEAPCAPGVHHVCYWSENSAEVCAHLAASGNKRVLGKEGAASGYFLSPSGMYIEVIHRELSDYLSDWLSRPPKS